MYQYRATVDRVVDGDTVDLNIDVGFYATMKIRCRLVDVDTPERGHAEFDESTQRLVGLLHQVADSRGYVYVQTNKTGKYGRWLARIGDREGTICVNDELAERWPG